MILLLSSLLARAQEPRAIDALVDVIHNLENERDDQEAALRLLPRLDPRREDIAEDIDAMTEDIDGLRDRLTLLSTGISPDHTPPTGSLEWDDQLQELLSPILSEVRALTERPRRIESLKTRIESYSQQITTAQSALGRLAQARESTTQEDTLAELQWMHEDWTDQKTTATELQAVAQLELDELSQSSQTPGELVDEVIELFVHLRGRNLLIAMSTFIAVFAGVRLLNRVMMRAIQRREIDTSSSIRIIQLVFYLLSSLGAIAAMLAVLYLLGDWFLLSVSLILLLGVGWGLREAVPRALEELQLMLNFGPVREGQRLVWGGVPWLVQRIHLRAVLVNPAFSEPLVLPLRELTGRISRPVSLDEDWFPTRHGDHLRLPDGRLAEVTGQGPDLVSLRTEVGPRVLPTADFLALAPTNLSRGFALEVLLPLHPRHQPAVTDVIPAALSEALADTGATAHTVRFHRIERDALIVRALLTFPGESAADYRRLESLAQAALLRRCLAGGWRIALPGLEIHTAEGEE